ncbi:MAG TPA: sugar ABC transporter substrate-binding protein [Caldilineae bacterium]|nr:sugar ABC transporter substrate-binding protein [Caldilineae bacterium]
MDEKRLSRRDFLKFSAGATAAAVLAACAPPAPAAKPEEKAPVEATPVSEVTTIHHLSIWSNETFAGTIALFEEMNPDLKVENEQLSWNAFFEQVQVRLAAGSPEPDTLAVDVPLTAPYGYRGWLLPLDDVFTEKEKADWLESSLQAGTYEGHLISAPVSTSTQLLFYNRNAFEKAGIEPPGEDERWTWEKLAEVAKELTFDEDGDGTPEMWGFIWEQVIRIYQLQPMPMSLGGVPIGPDGLTVRGYIDADPWIEAFTYYWKAFNEWKFAPQGDIGWPSDTLFRPGKLAMELAGPWNIKQNVDGDLDFEWGVSRHPYFENGVVVTPTGSWHIGVNANTKKIDAATRWVRFFSTVPGAEKWWRTGSHDFPAQESLLELIKTDPQFEEWPWRAERIAADEAMVNPQPRPVTPGYLEYEEILGDTFSDIRNGADVKEALNTAVERIEAEMEKYRK